MKQNALLAVAILSLICGAARAQDDGERPVRPPPTNVADEPVFMADQLKLACQPPAAADAAAKAASGKLCDAYIRGLADGLFMVGALDNSKIQLCLPGEGPLAVEDVRSEFLKYVTDHPAALEASAGLAGAFAIVAANPCAAQIMSRGEGQE